MKIDTIEEAYCLLCERWCALTPSERSVLLDRFKVSYSFNSGNIENPQITYHDTAEVFDRNGVSGFTGDVRTIYEISNLRHAWEWLVDAIATKRVIEVSALLDAHHVLTAGTYDETRWAKGERPGSFKIEDYRVADDVGLPPREVEDAVSELLAEVQEASSAPGAQRNTLTIAAYAHARLVDIHPFADGNGRTARLLMNYVLMTQEMPPCVIFADDRLAYFGALDAFHEEDDLEPFKSFCRVQTIKTWGEYLDVM